VTQTAPRNRVQLENAVADARTRRAKALAYFQLALFHDNNARERDAIPHYEAALRLGLDSSRRAEALAWLASSFYKTGQPRKALKKINESQNHARDAALCTFLDGLERRARRALLRERSVRV
jgi:tetratricopeptide (TPR) repeat protein